MPIAIAPDLLLLTPIIFVPESFTLVIISIMLFPILSTLTALSVLPLTSARILRNPNTKISRREVTAFQDISPLTVSKNVLTLTKKSSQGSKARGAAKLAGSKITNTKKSRGLDIAVGNSSVLTSLFEGEEFATNITFGTETFEVM